MVRRRARRARKRKNCYRITSFFPLLGGTRDEDAKRTWRVVIGKKERRMMMKKKKKKRESFEKMRISIVNITRSENK